MKIENGKEIYVQKKDILLIKEIEEVSEYLLNKVKDLNKKDFIKVDFDYDKSYLINFTEYYNQSYLTNNFINLQNYYLSENLRGDEKAHKIMLNRMTDITDITNYKNGNKYINIPILIDNNKEDFIINRNNFKLTRTLLDDRFILSKVDNKEYENDEILNENLIKLGIITMMNLNNVILDNIDINCELSEDKKIYIIEYKMNNNDRKLKRVNYF